MRVVAKAHAVLFAWVTLRSLRYPQDLTYITSGDIKGEAPPCCQEILCCGSGRDRVTLMTSSEGKKYLVLKKGHGEKVNRMILNQIEETQKIERD